MRRLNMAIVHGYGYKSTTISVMILTDFGTRVGANILECRQLITMSAPDTWRFCRY